MKPQIKKIQKPQSKMTDIKPNNVIRIPCKVDDVFRYWLEFLTPFHHLTDRELDVATQFLIERHNLSKVILDETILERTLLSEDTQKKIKEMYGIRNQHFQVIKSKLKAKKFFIGDKINPRLIPSVKEDKNSFQLLLLFDYATPNKIQLDN